MKTKDIAKEYNIDKDGFELYLKRVGADFRFGITGINLDKDIEGHVQRYKEYVKKEEAKLEAEAEHQRQLEDKKQKALANMLITSGFNFDGYKIKKYSGYISGDAAISIDRGKSGIFYNVTNVGESLTNSLVEIRRHAIKDLKEAAYNLGCNAVIGVDFDYITLEPETASSNGGTLYLPYVFCVTANGNAVIIEKIEE